MIDYYELELRILAMQKIPRPANGSTTGRIASTPQHQEINNRAPAGQLIYAFDAKKRGADDGDSGVLAFPEPPAGD